MLLRLGLRGSRGGATVRWSAWTGGSAGKGWASRADGVEETNNSTFPCSLLPCSLYPLPPTATMATEMPTFKLVLGTYHPQPRSNQTRRPRTDQFPLHHHSHTPLLPSDLLCSTHTAMMTALPSIPV
jgi:hypothetical protein